MEITILSYNLSNNCVGRALVLAEILERDHDVQIVGPIYGDGIWEPVRNYDFIQGVEMSSRIYSFPLRIAKLKPLISGDVLYASKTKMSSYGLSLIKGLSDQMPVVLDIDDWEYGLTVGSASPTEEFIRAVPRLATVNSLYYTLLCEKLAGLADAITTSNTFLQDRFGGTLLYHARDTDVFRPDRLDKQCVRDQLNLPNDKRIILFSGTPKEYKGIDDLIQATNYLEQEDIVLVIVGAPPDMVDRHDDDQILVFGRQPFDQLPLWVAAADVISIPQRKTRSTIGQIPAKLFDAMAMGKPIVSTNVNDIPDVLNGSGIVVPPNDPHQLAEALDTVLSDEELRKELGDQARERCVQKYSYDRYRPMLNQIFENVIE